jgi:hypothetical protein
VGGDGGQRNKRGEGFTGIGIQIAAPLPTANRGGAGTTQVGDRLAAVVGVFKADNPVSPQRAQVGA